MKYLIVTEMANSPVECRYFLVEDQQCPSDDMLTNYFNEVWEDNGQRVKGISTAPTWEPLAKSLLEQGYVEKVINGSAIRCMHMLNTAMHKA